MSDRQPKKVKEFYCIASRTRAKTQALENEILEARRNSSTCRRNNEPAPANRGSGAVPASIPPNTRRKGVQTRHNIVEIYDLEEVPVRKRGRPRESHHHKRNGERSASMYIEGVEMIDESEFRRRRRRKASNMEHSVSNKDSEETDIDKIVDEVDEELRNLGKVSSADHHESSYSKDSCNDTNQEKPQKSFSFVHRGSNKEDMAAGGIGVEVIDESEFRNQTRHSKSRKGRSLEQGFDSNPSAKNGNQDVLASCRKFKFAEIDESEFRKTRHSKSRKGRSLEQGFDSNPSAENGNQDVLTSWRKFKFAEIDGSEFARRKSRTTSKMGSARQESSAANSSRNADIVEELRVDSCCKYFTPEYSNRGFDNGQSYKLRSFTGKGNQDGVTSCRKSKLKEITAAEFTRGKSRTSSRMGSSARQGSSAANSMKNTGVVQELSADNCTSEVPGRASDKGQTDRSRSFTEKRASEKDDENSSDGAKHETTLRVSETRSKEITKEPNEVGNSGLSLNPDSQSYDAECPHSVDGVEELGTITLQYKESNCEKSTFQERKFRSRKRQLSSEASANQRKGRKTRKTCSIQEDNVERNRISADDSKAEDGLKPESTCPEQSYAQNNSDEANGVDGLHPKDQAEAGIMMEENEASSSHSKDDDNDDENKEPTRRQKVFPEQFDFCDRLADAILRNGSVFERALKLPPSQTESSLPLKFRFEDEVPKEVEKTEHEKEMEDLFAELDNLWAFGELGSSKYSEVDEEDENPLAEETHLDRCNRGKHELVLLDDEGLICIYCQLVALGPKDIMPDWAEKTHHGKRRYQEAEKPDLDGLDFQPSVNNAAADYGNRADGTVWSLKAGIRESMYEHQREGFEFLWKNLAGSIHLDELKSTNPREVGGCIISHAPGTGKTRLTINFIETYLRMFPYCLPVIISPAGMLLTWEEEFRKWNVGYPFLNLNNQECVTPQMKAVLKQVRGFNSRNQDDLRMVKLWLWSKGKSILGISYSLFEKLMGGKHLKGKKSKGEKPLEAKNQDLRMILLEKPGLVVLDEGHTPRNKSSNIWNALLKLKTDKRVILSGTPFQNNFGELFNTLHLVRPAIADVFTQERSFTEMSATRRGYKAQYNHSQSSLDKLKLIMAPFVHVHKGTILQQSLPGLRDCVILLKPSALQKSLIERVEGSISQNTFEYEHRVALISVHPYLLADIPEKQRIGIDMAAIEASKLNPNEGVKIKFILELVRLSMLLKEKVLIFSQFIQPLELIRGFLKECFNWAEGKQILRMVGKMDQKQRQVLINAFNDPKNHSKVMLGSTKCCSEGISLIGASRVVLLDVVWNPSVERQAISRAYRIGQKKFVHTYHLMTSGTTEADKYYRQSEKERLSELVFTSSSNECKKHKELALSIEDRVLEEMVSQEHLNGMFDKIINQPKDTDLIRTFGLN